VKMTVKKSQRPRFVRAGHPWRLDELTYAIPLPIVYDPVLKEKFGHTDSSRIFRVSLA